VYVEKESDGGKTSMSNDADMKTYNICSGLRNSLACNVNLEITSDVIKDLKFEDKDKDFARGQ